MHEPTSSEPLFAVPEGNTVELWQRFQQELAELAGETHFFDSHMELAAWMARQGCHRILVPDVPPLRQVLEGVEGIEWIGSAQTSREGWDAADAGITTILSAIAESGSLVVTSDIAGRAISVLPPVHFAVAWEDQIVPDLDSAMRLLRSRYGNQLPSSLSIISGPSRTADIEKILVLGAHGPKRLAVLVLKSGVNG
jgi:hypothetical protein